VGLQDGHGFFDLALQGVVVLQHVEQLGVVDLQQHAGDLAGEVWVHPLDQWEESLSQHLLLLLWRSRGQHGGRERHQQVVGS